MSIVTDAQKQQYINEGFFILENVIPKHHLDMLRSVAARLSGAVFCRTAVVIRRLQTLEQR